MPAGERSTRILHCSSAPERAVQYSSARRAKIASISAACVAPLSPTVPLGVHHGPAHHVSTSPRLQHTIEQDQSVCWMAGERWEEFGGRWRTMEVCEWDRTLTHPSRWWSWCRCGSFDTLVCARLEASWPCSTARRLPTDPSAATVELRSRAYVSQQRDLVIPLRPAPYLLSRSASRGSAQASRVAGLASPPISLVTTWGMGS